MNGKPDDKRRGRLVLAAFGVLALVLIVAAITSNLDAWRQSDAVETQQAGE